MKNTFVKVLDDTRDYLVLLHDEGTRELALAPDQIAALKVNRPVAKETRTTTTPPPSATRISSPPPPSQTQPKPKPVTRPKKSAWSQEAKPVTATSLQEIAADIKICTKCPLHKTRTNVVVGQGSSSPDIVFIGEGPGTQEDLKGEAFVGPAGKMLDRLLNKMGCPRNEIWIGNIVKCRPSVDFEMKKDRAPSHEEMSICLPYLQAQLAILKPKVIVTLGNTAMEGLFGFKGITNRHGKWLQYEGINTMPTYHPSYLCRFENTEKGKKLLWEVWRDMEQVLKHLGRL